MIIRLLSFLSHPPFLWGGKILFLIKILFLVNFIRKVYHIYVRARVRTCTFPCCISLPHIHAAYPSYMSLLRVYADVHAACPCCMPMLHVHAARPYCMSILQVIAACPYMSKVGINATYSSCILLLLGDTVILRTTALSTI
jgi:hypothetical protein